ncbi:hypothetical protein FIU97_19395 (plasmid) [Roseivivax sp. THAF40]|nr:hypothetical protein FIV09_18610 [Roseivivax sp. THAF197b]QFT48761.1 hypothetical protein FIU97_19395 [Roseivivax sp. THAF40]
MRHEGIGSDTLEAFVNAEAEARPELKIAPWEAPDAMDFRIAMFDVRGFRASWKREAIFRRLAQEDPALDAQLTLETLHENGGARSVIKLHSYEPLPRDAPLMLLDADADPEITNRLAEGARFLRIESRPEAEIVQVSDRTLSNSWLLDSEKGPQRRADLLTIIEREVQNASNQVLLVVTKAVLTALHRDAGTPIDLSDEAALLTPLRGATPRWFGPRMQGVNDFEVYSTILIAGRMQQPIPALEADARGLFGHDGDPFEESPSGMLPEHPGAYLMRNGSLIHTRRRSHSDARARVLLEQSRECSTLQAIARLRLVAPKTPKRVVILSSLPLPGLPISQLTKWKVMVAGLESEADPNGFQ